jgi:glycosyltransferase involved in cell wall biosynthesis
MNHATHEIRIAIHIDVEPGVSGGIAQSTQGLVNSLGKLDGPELYVLCAQTPRQAEWIDQYRGHNQILTVKSARHRREFGNARSYVKSMLRPWVHSIRRMADHLTTQSPRVPLSDGYHESLGCDVLHFPTQSFIVCSLPTIYNPHDLQQLHYPQFWTAWELARRETVYRAACNFSNTVVVGSEWIKQDVVRQYGVWRDKVQVIPWAPPTAHYPEIDASHLDKARERFALPATFALYPANTWPHKNHLRLLEALAELRDRHGLVVNLVCTGARLESNWQQIEQRLIALNLSSQVRFLGYVSEADLRATYRLAQFLILPTLFEADSCPIHEAWSEGLPVASSNHTALPDQVGDAGLLFDAKNVSAIADAIRRMATDDQLRHDLANRGFRRVKDFDWTRTARAYRAVYRRAAGVELNEEDLWLLSWDWMREPNRSASPASFEGQGSVPDALERNCQRGVVR